MPIATHIRPYSLTASIARPASPVAGMLAGEQIPHSPPCPSIGTTVSAERPLDLLRRRVSRADRPIQSARPDQRVASASRRAFPSPTAPRPKAGATLSGASQ